MQSDQRPEAKRSAPQNKLSDDEKAAILATCNQPEYASLPPSQIVPRLADKGIYMASESSFYRVLNSFDQVHHRGQITTLMSQLGIDFGDTDILEILPSI